MCVFIGNEILLVLEHEQFRRINIRQGLIAIKALKR